MSQEQKSVEAETQKPVEAQKPETAKVEVQAAPPAKEASADLAALIDAAVSAKTAPYVAAAQVAELANQNGIPMAGAQRVAAIQKDNPKLSVPQAILLAKAEHPNDFAQTRSNLYSHLPVGGESALRSAPVEKSTEVKYEEAIDFKNNGANGSRAAGAAVMRAALRQNIQFQLARSQGVAV